MDNYLSILKKCLVIESLSGRENKFLKHLATQFHADTLIPYDANGFFDCPCLGVAGNPQSDLVFICHVDRIRVFTRRSPRVYRTKYLSTQLDNALGVATLLGVFQSTPINIIYDGGEEIGRSALGISLCLTEMQERLKLRPRLINVDITGTTEKGLIQSGAIAIKRSGWAKYDVKLVRRLKKLASKMNVPFVDNFYRRLPIDVDYFAGNFSVASIAVPVLHYHSSREIASLEAINNAGRLIQKLASHTPMAESYSSTTKGVSAL